MPISPIILQRRHAELGRIRLGQKNPDRGFPMKLSSFRFTSPSQRYITDLAELYGGQVQPWDNNGKAEFEVFTTATTLPVYVVKGGLSQWMETWVGGGIAHRCDGERQADGTPCDPDEWIEVKEKGKPKRLYVHRDAKPTTRLSVMLPELDAIGVWRMESHGWNAAAEIPAVAELAQFVGELVPAELHLVERRIVKDGQTSRFVVPVLDLRIGQARLREVVASLSGGAAEIEGPATSQAAAIEAPRPDYKAQADALTDVSAVADLWRAAAAAGHLDDDLKAYLTGRAEAIKPSAPPVTVPQANEDGTVDAEIVEEQPATPPAVSVPDDLDPDVVWQQILKTTGALGWSLAKTQADFQTSMGLDSGEASAAELQAYLTQITTGEQVPA